MQGPVCFSPAAGKREGGDICCNCTCDNGGVCSFQGELRNSSTVGKRIKAVCEEDPVLMRTRRGVCQLPRVCYVSHLQSPGHGSLGDILASLTVGSALGWFF